MLGRVIQEWIEKLLTITSREIHIIQNECNFEYFIHHQILFNQK